MLSKNGRTGRIIASEYWFVQISVAGEPPTSPFGRLDASLALLKKCTYQRVDGRTLLVREMSRQIDRLAGSPQGSLAQTGIQPAGKFTEGSPYYFSFQIERNYCKFATSPIMRSWEQIEMIATIIFRNDKLLKTPCIPTWRKMTNDQRI